MFYPGSNMVVLDNPTETEMMLTQDSFDDSTVVVWRETTSQSDKGLIEYTLGEDEPFTRVYLKEIATILKKESRGAAPANLMWGTPPTLTPINADENLGLVLSQVNHHTIFPASTS